MPDSILTVTGAGVLFASFASILGLGSPFVLVSAVIGCTLGYVYFGR